MIHPTPAFIAQPSVNSSHQTGRRTLGTGGVEKTLSGPYVFIPSPICGPGVAGTNERAYFSA